MLILTSDNGGESATKRAAYILRVNMKSFTCT